MKIKMYLYEKETKYTQVEPDAIIVHDDVEKLEVISVPKAEQLKTTDEEMIDEFNEYLVLTFKNHDTATFRNSHVDCFQLR